MNASQLIEPIGRKWAHRFAEFLTGAQTSLTISTAYVTSAGVDFLLKYAAPEVLAQGDLTLLTDLSPDHVAQGATDPEALTRLYEHSGSLRLVHLPRLHSKVYIVDDQKAIVTSGNLTSGGLWMNYEYGLCIRDPYLAGEVRRDVTEYAALGACLSATDLTEFCLYTREAKKALAEARVPSSTQERYREAVAQAKDVLVRKYAGSEPIHTVFERTVLYVLQHEGAMRTSELHKHIQAIHSDLCDDENRVIGGDNFGRKWKHAVRTAQQHLKARGLIARNGNGQWFHID